METSIRNAAFAKSLAISYSEYFDGISPKRHRASLRVTEEGSLEITDVETRRAVHWNLKRIREVPDQADAGAAIFAPDNEGAARLIIREAEALRVLIDTDAPLPPLGRKKGQVAKTLITAIAAAACFAGLLFAIIPHFAGRIAENLPVETEIAMGNLVVRDGMLQAYSTCSSPEGDRALARMVARLEDEADLYLPLQVRVVNTPIVNAFASMGGQVVLFSGLIDAAETPEQVASVLAHEIGHVANRDAVRMQFEGIGTFGLVGLLFGDVFGVSTASGVTSMLVRNTYSRAAEVEADAYAHNLMLAADLPPEALGEFFELMTEEQGQGLPEFLSTHPDTSSRIEAAMAAAQPNAATQPLLSDDEWAALQTICSGGATSSK